MDLENVRMKFKITSKVVPTIRKNFPGKYKSRSLNCPSCRNLNSDDSNPQEDTQFHLMFECPTFEDLRADKDFGNDDHLTAFFKAVIDYRAENDQN